MFQYVENNQNQTESESGRGNERKQNKNQVWFETEHEIKKIKLGGSIVV